MADVDGNGCSSGNFSDDVYQKKPISEWQESDIKAAREFIEATVLNISFKALCELVKERPDDPIQYVIDFLIKYKDEYSKDISLMKDSKKMESGIETESRQIPDRNHWVEISLATNSQTEESLEAFFDPELRVKFENLSASSEIQHNETDLDPQASLKSEELSTQEISLNLDPQASLKSEELSTQEISLKQQGHDVKDSSSVIEQIDFRVKKWQMQWKKTFPAKRPQIENPKEGYKILPTRFYLEATVLSIIRDALDIIIIERPEDPILCMTDFMKKYKALYQS
ncbi:uncharacterized protein [Parasteatoda tepidariorum]|uniref:uncharacterized protein isoform X2 n=1 Tax=Parasteatoda tepidariorum TaxID=114398 RepID=UPI0039BC54CD